MHGSFSPFGFTRFAMLVSVVVAVGKKRTQFYPFDLTSPLVVVSLHKEMFQLSAENVKSCKLTTTKSSMNKCNSC